MQKFMVDHESVAKPETEAHKETRATWNVCRRNNFWIDTNILKALRDNDPKTKRKHLGRCSARRSGRGFQVSAYQLIMSRQMSVSWHKTALAQDAGELGIPLRRTKSQRRAGPARSSRPLRKKKKWLLMICLNYNGSECRCGQKTWDLHASLPLLASIASADACQTICKTFNLSNITVIAASILTHKHGAIKDSHSAVICSN